MGATMSGDLTLASDWMSHSAHQATKQINKLFSCQRNRLSGFQSDGTERISIESQLTDTDL